MDCPGENLRVCIIGSGFGGLCAAIQLRKKLNINRLTIFEKNADVGGCWFSNTYPGCGSDCSGHLYSYSFEPKSDWEKVYASQSETLDYLQNVARKFGLYRHIKFNHLVKRMTWNENENYWKVAVTNESFHGKCQEKEYPFDFVISAVGHFHLPNIPEEFKNFQGPIIHTGKWDSRVNLEGKSVAVVGSGSSVVQLVPAIVDNVKRLVSYQRNPSWILPKNNFAIPNWVKWGFQNVPGFQKSFRNGMFLIHESMFTMLQSGTITALLGGSIAKLIIETSKNIQLKKNPELKTKLQPEDVLGCRRVTVSSEFYKSLSKPNVNVVTSKITQINGQSITTEDGQTETVDVLILGTGFKVQEFFAPMEIIGRNSENILQKWKSEGPEGYFGVFFYCMPNMGFIQGPGTDNGHNCSVFSIECEVNMIVKILQKLIQTKSKAVSVKKSAQEEYMKSYFKKLEKTVYSRPECQDKKSYYYNQKGVVTSIYPENQTTFWWKTKHVDINQFDFL